MRNSYFFKITQLLFVRRKNKPVRDFRDFRDFRGQSKRIDLEIIA